MAALSRQSITKAGAAVTFASAAGGGDTLANPTAWDVLLIKNGDTSSKTVTLVVPGTDWNGQAIADTPVVVPAGETWAVKLDPRYASSGTLSITYSAVTSVTVAVVTY